MKDSLITFVRVFSDGFFCIFQLTYENAKIYALFWCHANERLCDNGFQTISRKKTYWLRPKIAIMQAFNSSKGDSETGVAKVILKLEF